MIIIGLFFIALMGIILGVLGGGGSLLTVPVLSYCFGIPATIATGYSLFVVGMTSLVGVFSYTKKKLLNYRVAFLFSIPSSLGVFISRKWILPVVPEMMSFSGLSVGKDQLILLVFAVLVCGVSIKMLKKDTKPQTVIHPTSLSSMKIGMIFFDGFLMGIVAGFVGAGGGFLIVPVLVFLVGLPFRNAVATSLLIIFINSAIGLIGDVSEGMVYDWPFLMGLSAITVIGMVFGIRWSDSLPTHRLKQSFGYFIAIMGVGILLKELL